MEQTDATATTGIVFDGRSRDFELRIKVEEVLYEVMARTGLLARIAGARGSDSGEPGGRGLQADDDEHVQYCLRRSLEHAWGVLQATVGEYIRAEATSGSDDVLAKEIDGGGVLVLGLRVPGNADDARLGSLGGMVHRYLVEAVEGAWLRISSAVASKEHVERANGLLVGIKGALSARRRPRYVKTEYKYGDDSLV